VKVAPAFLATDRHSVNLTFGFDNLPLNRYAPGERALNDQTSVDRLPDDLPVDPMFWADAWIKEATASDLQPHPNAMTLATASADGRPSTRVVLCKDFVPDPGYLVFYTNYRSRKSLEIEQNPGVAVGFHWDTLGRQLRIEGVAIRSPEEESDRYFGSRDWGSQLGAWGSDQSEPIGSRQDLVSQIRARASELGIELADDETDQLKHGDPPPVKRPPHWGGFRVWATSVELWIAGADRIHDRALWSRNVVPSADHKFTVTPWAGERLQP
jgi:pyridoxamine 5'-phosphate oxidase